MGAFEHHPHVFGVDVVPHSRVVVSFPVGAMLATALRCALTYTSIIFYASPFKRPVSIQLENK